MPRRKREEVTAAPKFMGEKWVKQEEGGYLPPSLGGTDNWFYEGDLRHPTIIEYGLRAGKIRSVDHRYEPLDVEDERAQAEPPPSVAVSREDQMRVDLAKLRRLQGRRYET